MKRALLFAVAALVGVGACSTGSTNGGSCPPFDTDPPDVCPSWSNVVQPLMVKYCYQCHTSGGPGQSLFNPSTYGGVFTKRSTVSVVVDDCAMPLGGAAAYPTNAERQTILSWIACKAPDN
jgi:hypothetical protein